MLVHSLWLHVQCWSKQKVKIIVFHCHLFFFRLWHIRSSIHPSLNIIYSICLDASENRLWYTHIQLYFTPFSKVQWYELFTINAVNLSLKTFHFQRLLPGEYIEIIFYSRFIVFIDFLIFLLLSWKFVYLFLKKTYCLPEARFFV